MALFYKSNSCLLAFDDSPAFSTGQLGLTGQKYGLYFAKLLQDFEFSISPAKTQSKQIGSYDFGVDSVNFSPDVICNLSYITRDDFEVEKLLGLNFNIDGEYQPVFSGIDGHSFNAYLFFTDQEGVDLPTYISGANNFSGVNVISIGNCYLSNGAINMQAGSTPRSTMSFVASNCEMQTLVENYMQIPAINLESGTTGGAADIYLNPAQTHRFLEGGVSGTLLETWKATFQPQFEDVQIANQKLVNANIQSIGLSFTVDRENVYSFGSDHVYSRDVKYPIVGSLSINGVASEYQTGSFASLMQNEETYDITIYNADPQELYLSGLPISELSGVYKLNHLTADQWFRVPNTKLRDSTNRVGVGGFVEFANTFDFSSSPVGGFNYKKGEETSLDSVYIYSSDGHRLVSSDGYRPIYDPFIYFFNDQENCEVVTMLSADRKICMCLDNFVESRISCPRGESFNAGYYPMSVIAKIGSQFYDDFGIDFAFSSSFGTFANQANRNYHSYADVVYLSGEIQDGYVIEGFSAFYNQGLQLSGQNYIYTEDSFSSDLGIRYRVGNKMFYISGNTVIETENFDGDAHTYDELMPTSADGGGFYSYNPSNKDRIWASIENSNGAQFIEMWLKTGISSPYFNGFNYALDQFAPDNNGVILPPLSSGTCRRLILSSVWPTNIMYVTLVSYQGTGFVSGSESAVVRNTATGLNFPIGSTTSSSSATLTWSGFNTGITGVQPLTWNMYSFESGVTSPSIYATGFVQASGILSGLSNVSSYYGAFLTTVVDGYESPTGQCQVQYIQRV